MNLDVRIKTTAEGQGAQQTADGLKKVTQEANQAKAATTDVAKATETLSSAGEGYKKTIEGVVKEQDKWNISKNQAIGALKKLKDAIPGLGFAIDALKNPYTAITAGIAAFVLHVTRQIEKQRELERASLDMGMAIDTARAAMNRAKGDYTGLEEAADAYLQKMREIADQEHGIDATTSKQLRAIDRQTDIETRTEQARLAAGERQVDASVASGKLTPAAGEVAKRRLREASAGRMEGIKSGSDKRKFDVMQEATLQRMEQAAAAEAALPDAETEAKRLLDEAAKAKAGAPGLKVGMEAELATVKRDLAEAEIIAAQRANQPFISRTQVELSQDRVKSLQARKVEIEGKIAAVDETVSARATSANQAQARVKMLQAQSASARSSAVGYELKGQEAQADMAQAGALKNALAPFIQQESAANAIIEALKLKEEADKARDKAIIDALRGMGLNARATKAAVEAENGR